TAARRETYAEPPRRYALLSSFAFDSSVAGIFWTLASRGTLLLVPDGVAKDPPELVRFPAAARATHRRLPPSLDAAGLRPVEPADALGELLTVVVAGEACAREVVERHHRLFPRVALFNEYGPTEASVWSSVHRCEPGAARALVPIGRPIPRARLHVLDARG